MSGIMPICSNLPAHLKKTNIPRAFINDDDIRWVLRDLTSDLQHEERQALYYSCVFDTTIEDVADKIELSQIHTASILTLYMARLTSMLDFFKKVASYDENDLLPVSELLFPESM